MVDSVSVPGLGNVDLAFVWPSERLEREKPEGRPDARRAG